MAVGGQSVTPEEYDAWYDSPRGRWVGDSEFELLCRHIDTNRGTSVLDVGCGTGWFTRRLAAAGFNVTGLDVDADALDFARQRSDHDISYVEGDACRLPFPDQSFDQVISITALCFVDDWPRAIAEIVRVTRRGFTLGLLNRHSLLWLDKGRRGSKGALDALHVRLGADGFKSDICAWAPKTCSTRASNRANRTSISPVCLSRKPFTKKTDGFRIWRPVLKLQSQKTH